MKRFLEQAKSGDQAAFSRIVREYRPLMESLVAKYALSADEEDLRQEAMIALYSAVCSFDGEQDQVTFGVYAKVCIRNRLISLLRKRSPDGMEISEVVEYPSEQDEPERDLLARERYRALLALIEQSLSDLEKRVLALYLEDIPYAQIAKRLGVTEKTVDNAIYRLKSKLRKRI